jgi:hypothetical protein
MCFASSWSCRPPRRKPTNAPQPDVFVLFRNNPGGTECFADQGFAGEGTRQGKEASNTVVIAKFCFDELKKRKRRFQWENFIPIGNRPTMIIQE